jgi:ATP-dependent RNA helicase DOB1
VLLNVQQGSSTSTKRGTHVDLGSGVQPCPPTEKGEFAVMPVLLSTINGISHVRIYLEKDLKPLAARDKAFKHIGEVKKKFPDCIPLLDPIKNMGIKDDEFKKLIKVSLHIDSRPSVK